MTQQVDPEKIERIVGVKRHPTEHVGKADTEAQQIYIMHSEECVNELLDLRDCPFSLALNRGVQREDVIENVPVVLEIVDRDLVGLKVYR